MLIIPMVRRVSIDVSFVATGTVCDRKKNMLPSHYGSISIFQEPLSMSLPVNAIKLLTSETKGRRDCGTETLEDLQVELRR